MIYMMRYSFFGNSGWRAPASKQADLLFDPARLQQRAYFAEKIALASLRDQTDGDFELIVLSSTLMPENYQKQLSELAQDMLGQRAHVIFRAPDSAGNWFQRYRRRTFGKHLFTSQIVLDDDDALAVDFNEICRAEAHAAMNLRRPGMPDYTFLSFPRGITARFLEGEMQLSHRVVPATNLGLALVGPTELRRNPFAVAHKKIPERHPCRLIHSNVPHYIRALHGHNDSRGHFSTQMVTEAQMPAILKAFPLLKPLAADWTQPEAQRFDAAA
jgi:hypothetical protein